MVEALNIWRENWPNESFCQMWIAFTAPILGMSFIWLKPPSQIGIVVSRNKSYHRRKSRQWFEGERCLRELPQVFAKTNMAGNCKKWWKMVSNSNRLFSHCFRKTKNRQLKFLLSCWFSVWTSQGLNLGPPDYESVALTNWATSPKLRYETP